MTVTYDSHYIGKPILADESLGYGCDVDILARLDALLTDMTHKHCKVLFIRFDVHFPQELSYPDDNRLFRNFMAALIRYCHRKRQDPAYLWVREQVRSENQHYHCVLLLDGNRTQKCYPVLQKAQSLWSSALEGHGNGLVHFCDSKPDGSKQQNGLMIRKDKYAAEGIEETCFRWGSYLAKINTKDTTLYNTRSVGNSRFPQELYQQSLATYRQQAGEQI